MTRIPLVLAVLLGTVGAARAADAPACVIHGSSVTMQTVTVTPQGAPAFELGLYQAQVTAELPTRCGAPLTLRITGSIELTAKRTNVWLHLTRDVTSPDGLITAKAGSQIIDVCVRGDRVIGSAVLYADDVLEGEMKRPSEVVRDFDVPCDALTLDMLPVNMDDTSSAEGTDHYWELRGEAEHVTLRVSASAKSRGRLMDAPNSLRQIKAKRGWLFVETTGEGVTVRGWVPTSLLKRIPDDTFSGHSYGCSGDHGGSGWGELPPAQSVEREGTVRASTLIYAEPAAGVWGRFVVPVHIKVRITPGSSWAELRRVPGLVGDPSGSPWLHGLVPLDTMTLDPLPAPNSAP